MRTLSPRLYGVLVLGCLLLLVGVAPLAGCGGPGDARLPLEIEGRVVPFSGDGGLLVPEGALDKKLAISAVITCTPLLPDGVEAMGSAIAISCAQEPSAPVLVRRTIPKDAGDPANLVFARIEPNGATTFLMSWVEVDSLVVATTRFGTFVMVRLAPGTALQLNGKRYLLNSERETYSVSAIAPHNVRDTAWTWNGTVATVGTGDTAALVMAAGRGWGAVHCELIDTERGWRWFGAKYVYVTENRLALQEQGFWMDVTTTTPLVYGDQDVQIRARVYGPLDSPLSWFWDFGDGETGGPVTTTTKLQECDLPVKRFMEEGLPRSYEVAVLVTDAEGREAGGSLTIDVIDEPQYEVRAEGPLNLSWVDPGVSATYTARASGGEPPYYYTWMLLPGNQAPPAIEDVASRQTFLFDQPGEYQLVVRAVDDIENQAATSARAVLPILVDGRRPLRAMTPNLGTAGAGERLDIDVQVSGGVLVVSGKKGGYALTVDWGDGSSRLMEPNVALERTSIQGAAVRASHVYANPGRYAVWVQACDATGAAVSEWREITIVAAGAASRTPTPTGMSGLTGTGTPTRTGTASGTPTATPTASKTRSPTATRTGTRWATRTVTRTATRTPKATATRTPTSYVGPIRTRTATGTRTPTRYIGPGGTPTATRSRTPPPSLVWVLQGDPVVNWEGNPLSYENPEARFEGTYTNYRVSETAFSMDDRWVDHGWEAWNVRIESVFESPEQILVPGDVHKLTVHFSHSGTVADGSPGAQFWYSADRSHSGIIKPGEVLAYYPWSAGFDGTASKTWTLTVPEGRKGDTMQIYAGWWNSPVSNVTWTYRLE